MRPLIYGVSPTGATVRETRKVGALQTQPIDSLVKTRDTVNSSVKNVLDASSGISRAERTAGGPAVSGINGRERQEGATTLLPASPGQTHGVAGGYCGRMAVLSECKTTLHTFAKRIVCGAEWCPECGEEDSQAHRRRIARWIPKAMQLRGMGYFVIEWPDRYRKSPSWVHSRRAVDGVTKAIIEVIAGKRQGGKGRSRRHGYFPRGLTRWHWFGEKVQGKYNPHLNILVDAGHLKPELLAEIKAKLRAAVNTPDLIVNYQFTRHPRKMMHLLRYVTRATFRNYQWDEWMAGQLFGFRNSRWWGSWHDEPVWTLEQADEDTGLLAANELSSGKCPECHAELEVLYHNHEGRPVYWTSPVDISHDRLTEWGAVEYAGTGYYLIPAHYWRPDVISPDEYLRLEKARYAREYEKRALLRHGLETAIAGEYLPPEFDYEDTA